MGSVVLGRTNRSFPRLWLRLLPPPDAAAISGLLEAAWASGAPLDVSSSPALWGGTLRNRESILVSRSPATGTFGVDGAHTGDLFDANLIASLSCIGRDYWDFFFLTVRSEPTESSLEGALASLELARQDGHIRHLGLACAGDPSAAARVLTAHDAFEVLLASPAALAVLAPLARARRLGLIADGASAEECGADVGLVAVRSEPDVAGALALSAEARA